MGAVAEAVAGAVSGVADIGFGLYDRYYQAKMNERDFDYQKALQQQIFEREDNAVQRRRADLEAAGLNPNLAAGSAAGAGSVVGRSSTPGLPKIGNPIGTALDSAAHVAQLKAQNIQNKILRNQERESKAKADLYDKENMLNDIEFNNMLGIGSNLSYDNKSGEFELRPNFDIGKDNWSVYTSLMKNGGYGYTKDLSNSNSRIMNYLNWQYQNNQNSAAMLQKDYDFYTADKIANYLGVGASMFSNAGRGWSLFNNKQYRR